MVANLTRYEPCRTIDGWNDFPDCRPCASGNYVKFEEAVEASSNSLQRLKAEIALVLNTAEYVDREGVYVINFHQFDKLRQLTAV
jgi:hypothetical protein